MINKPPSGIQTWIHFLEEGAGRLWLRRFLIAVFMAAVVVVYHFMEARNFMAAEAMDQAQLGRNLAEHRGYTTWNIRPLSIHLLQDKARAQGQSPNQLLNSPHPDLENPPVYPVILAGVLKLLPATVRWSGAAEPAVLHRLPPEMAISWFNLGLLLVVVLQVYRLGRLLFDPSVALLAATITFGTELLWRFVYSGLSTMWLLVLVLFLARLLVAWERGLPTPEPTSGRRQTLLALLIGATLGVMFLTRYSTGLLLVPALAFIVWLGGARRWRSAAAVFLAFTVLVTPWLYRNWRLCGQPFGTAGYALFATTESFPEDKLARSFQPAAGELHLKEVVNKVVTNSLDLLENDLPRFGGNWLAAFFLVGLLVPFQNASLQRLRWFVLASLVLLFLGQAAGRTHFDTLTPTVNPGNLLVLLTPLVFLFGAAFFGLVLDNVPFPFPLLRSLAQLGATLLLCLPLVVALGSDLLAIPGLIPRREYPLAEPYSPTVIRELSSYTPEGSLIVSDVPWAVAWYGGRTSAWIPLHVQDGYKEDFFVLNDYQRPVQALYLSPLTLNQPWHKSFFEPNMDHAWFRLVVDLALRSSIPNDFPLKAVPAGYLQFGHLFLAQKAWWVKPETK